jgi:hypothetical protein
VVPTCRLAAILVLAALSAACNTQRKQECERLLAVMKPLEQGVPSADTVDRVNHDVEALALEDQPLHIYAENYQRTLTVLSNTLALQASPSAPDGTDDVIKSRLREARVDHQDVARYCAQ